MVSDLKSDILKRIDVRLEALDVTDRHVSLKACGTPDVIRNWRNKPVLPRLDTLIPIAHALGVTPEWLIFNTGSDSVTPVPLISWVSAGSFDTADPVYSFDEFPTVEIAGLPNGDWVAMEVQGDSMDRVSPPGSIIFVNRADRRLSHNACYIIQDIDGSATYKRYRQSPMRFEPVSTNPVHEPIFPDNENPPNVFGRVLRSVLDM
jgi:SOS-response transcriptional repressor LexA